MSLHRLQKSKLVSLKENSFRLEKEIQFIVENNIKELFGWEFVKSEFSIGSFRIDTLVFDKESKSFIIIEYKKGKNFSVIDQGYAYLSLMLNNKADFILEYNESLNKNLRKDNVDWSQSKVIFISPFFSTFQKESINFKDLPIELFEINRFESDLIIINPIKAKNAVESIKTISSKDNRIKNVSNEIKVYNEEDLLNNASLGIKDLYQSLKENILNLGDVQIKPTKLYVGFIARTNFADIHIQRNSLKIWLNLKKGNLLDFKQISRNVSQIGHWGNGDYELLLKLDTDLEYVMSLIKQSYDYNK